MHSDKIKLWIQNTSQFEKNKKDKTMLSLRRNETMTFATMR